jgi:hypothetical protein
MKHADLKNRLMPFVCKLLEQDTWWKCRRKFGRRLRGRLFDEIAFGSDFPTPNLSAMRGRYGLGGPSWADRPHQT